MRRTSNSTNLNIRVDKDLKQQADKLYKNLGMNTSVAINMFLKQSVRQQALPFVPDMCLPSEELQEALNELRDVVAGKKQLRGYHNVRQMFEDILNEDD